VTAVKAAKRKKPQIALQAGQNKKPPEPLAMHTIKVPDVINSAANQRKRSGKFIANARGKLIAARSDAVFLGIAAEL
jgi:hypothetical protein